jgi:hypothetical protein
VTTLTASGATQINSTLGATGLTTATGGIKIGSTGATILAHYSATSTFNPGSITSGSCSGLGTITVTGAALGDEAVVGRNTALVGSSWVLTGYVSAANTVQVTLCNFSGSAGDGGANDTYRADVWHH